MAGEQQLWPVGCESKYEHVASMQESTQLAERSKSLLGVHPSVS